MGSRSVKILTLLQEYIAHDEFHRRFRLQDFGRRLDGSYRRAYDTHQSTWESPDIMPVAVSKNQTSEDGLAELSEPGLLTDGKYSWFKPGADIYKELDEYQSED